MEKILITKKQEAELILEMTYNGTNLSSENFIDIAQFINKYVNKDCFFVSNGKIISLSREYDVFIHSGENKISTIIEVLKYAPETLVFIKNNK